MNILKELESRKERMLRYEKDRTKYETLYEGVLKRLEEQGLNTLEEAEAEIERRKKLNAEATEAAQRLIEEFDEKYKDFQ